MMGKQMPPILEPETAMPMTNARRFRKKWEMMLICRANEGGQRLRRKFYSLPFSALTRRGRNGRRGAVAELGVQTHGGEEDQPDPDAAHDTLHEHSMPKLRALGDEEYSAGPSRFEFSSTLAARPSTMSVRSDVDG